MIFINATFHKHTEEIGYARLPDEKCLQRGPTVVKS